MCGAKRKLLEDSSLANSPSYHFHKCQYSIREGDYISFNKYS